MTHHNEHDEAHLAVLRASLDFKAAVANTPPTATLDELDELAAKLRAWREAVDDASGR